MLDAKIQDLARKTAAVQLVDLNVPLDAKANAINQTNATEIELWLWVKIEAMLEQRRPRGLNEHFRA